MAEPPKKTKRIVAGLSLASEQAIERLRALAESQHDLDHAEVLDELRNLSLVVAAMAESITVIVDLLAEMHDGTVIDADDHAEGMA